MESVLLMKGYKDSAYFIEEIHQSSQLGSLQAGQILFLFVTLDQPVKMAQEVRGRSAERTEALQNARGGHRWQLPPDSRGSAKIVEDKGAS